MNDEEIKELLLDMFESMQREAIVSEPIKPAGTLTEVVVQITTAYYETVQPDMRQRIDNLLELAETERRRTLAAMAERDKALADLEAAKAK